LVAFHCQLHSKKYAKYINEECVVIYQTAHEWYRFRPRMKEWRYIMLAIFYLFRKTATQIYGCSVISKKTSGSFFPSRAQRDRQKLVDQKDIR
jgi:hypothetical protein